MNRITTIALSILIAAILSTAYLLDGPSELDAIRDVQADLVDAHSGSN